jgi:hypothetical protein
MNMFSVNTGKRRLTLILLVILYALGIAFLANGIIVGSALLGLGIWLTLEMLIEILPKTREIILTIINPMRLSRTSDRRRIFTFAEKAARNRKLHGQHSTCRKTSTDSRTRKE